MKLGDRWICGVAVAAALLFFSIRYFTAAPGSEVHITTPTTSHTLSLSQDTVLRLLGQDALAVTVTVEDGGVRFSHSDCPDKLCVHAGRLKNAGDCAACLPAGITLRVTGKGEVDAIAD